MPRIRTIKPEFFTSLTIADLPITARLTFIGLWTHCDDEGRCVDDARLIKAAVWPLDDRTAAEVEEDLKAIAHKSLIIRYEVDGRRYLAVRNWREHQRVNRPTPSRIPPPPPISLESHKGLSDDSVSTHGALTEDSLRAQTDSDTGAGEPSSQPEMSDFDEAVHALSSDPPTRHDEPRQTALTSGNALNEDSLSAHGGLTEDSRQERNREQGTGKLVIPPSAGTASPRRAKQSTNDPNAGAIVAAWVEAATAATGERPANRLINQVGRQAKELLAEGKNPGRLIEAARAAGSKGFADLGRELLRAGATKQATNPATSTATTGASAKLPPRGSYDPSKVFGTRKATA